MLAEVVIMRGLLGLIGDIMIRFSMPLVDCGNCSNDSTVPINILDLFLLIATFSFQETDSAWHGGEMIERKFHTGLQ